MANQKKEKSIQSTQSKTDKTRENKARENAGDQVLHSIRYLHIVFTLQKIVQAKSCNISKDAFT